MCTPGVLPVVMCACLHRCGVCVCGGGGVYIYVALRHVCVCGVCLSVKGMCVECTCVSLHVYVECAWVCLRMCVRSVPQCVSACAMWSAPVHLCMCVLECTCVCLYMYVCGVCLCVFACVCH